MKRKLFLNAYIAAIGVATLLVIGFAVAAAAHQVDSAHWSNATILYAAFFAILSMIASRQLLYYQPSSQVAMGTAAQVAAIVSLPLPFALLAVAAGKALSELSLLIQGKRKARAVVVNIGGTLLANVAGGTAFHLLHGGQFLWSSGLTPLLALPAFLSLSILYHAVDALVIVGAISLSSNESPWRAFRDMALSVFAPHLSLGFVGLVFAVLWHFSPVLSLLIMIPIWLSMRSFQAVARLQRETVEAVLKMAESIDYRDTGTYEHSKRIADMTRRLARSLGLTPEHISDIVLASQVHDLGKIGISNDILLKTGRLTDEEYVAMQEHPVIGEEILRSYSAFRSSATIVRHHHERWDGKGYPDGLKGEEIPLGSRIITVVDSFDAMTDDRVYRKGMSVEDAVQRLKDGIGSQFDPRVCGAFIQMLIDEGVYTPPETHPDLLRLVRESAAG
ncbi:MAG TPA: HD-GYP domain-containing protein [Chloroflexota bacterium]|nr:HD-GYP domain-containing protein [Chloroflexota bacterium]